MAASKGRINFYEGFFLASQAAAQDLKACVDHIAELIKRGEGEIVAFQKWDERRLAYEIKNHKRGVYFLVYFKADPANLGDIERVANLSETLLRFMITRVEHLTEDEMRAKDDMSRLLDEANLRSSENADAEPSHAPADDAGADVPADAEQPAATAD